MQKLFVNLLIWLIAHREIKPCFFIHNTLIVGKGIEPAFSVVGAHAACTEAAEAHLACGKVDNRIINTPSAKAAAGGNLCGFRLIICKDIKC